MARDGGERADWIRELSETNAQLGRLFDQLVELEQSERRDFQGIRGRIDHLRTRLSAIEAWLNGRA